MEFESRNILFIDDDCERHIAKLEYLASEQGFKIFAVDNVEEGLHYLESYHSVIHTVILDLTFPIREMQGMEALQVIRKKYAYMPVIILTDSESSEDIEKVVECIKNGAYGYVGKKFFNPEYLFQMIGKAIDENTKTRYITETQKERTSDHSLFTVSHDYSYGLYNKRTIFGFNLSVVNRPTDESEAENMQIQAMAWHEGFLKAVSVPFHDAVQVNFKFRAKNGQVQCMIIVSVLTGKIDDLKSRVSQLYHDIGLFFENDGKYPYWFEMIIDKKTLLDSVENSPAYNYTLVYRTPVKIKKNSSLGFSRKEEDKKPNYIYHGTPYEPDALFPLPEPLSPESTLFEAMTNHAGETEIDVQLLPRKLLPQDIDLITKVIDNPSLIDDKNYNGVESDLYVKYLKKFLSSQSCKFLISVIIKNSNQPLGEYLKASVKQHFFGSETNVGYENRLPDKLLRFQTNLKKGSNQIPFYYDLHYARQLIRLPLPGSGLPDGIHSQLLTFQQFPGNLPSEGILTGVKLTGNGNLPIRIDEGSLARHMYIMGQTGTGKSTLLKTMIADCLKKNYGFAVIDPHGDLFDEIEKMIPKSKRSKLLVLSTTDPANSAKHNPISYDKKNPQSKSLVINELIRIFGTLYDMRHAGGPMFELYLKNGLLVVLDDEVQKKHSNPTLQEFVKLFFDDSYRSELISLCDNKKVNDFFKVAEKNTGDWSFHNFATYITSKLTRFTDDYYITPIISSKKGNINFRKLIDEGNILLVKMDKGLIGPDNVSLLGQMLVSSMVLASMSRSNMQKHERKPYYLFIDEFQNFIKGDIATALSEVRKYGLSLVLANQTLGQLEHRFAENDLVEALMGNVGSMVFFRPGINDYQKVRHYLEPDFNREDVLKLPNFNCIARLLIDNVPCDPFVFQTLKD